MDNHKSTDGKLGKTEIIQKKSESLHVLKWNFTLGFFLVDIYSCYHNLFTSAWLNTFLGVFKFIVFFYIYMPK